MTIVTVVTETDVVTVAETDVVTVTAVEAGPQGPAGPAGPAGPGTDLGYTAATRLLTSSSGADVTLPLFTSTDAGLTPYSGGGTTNFLRADGTWAAPAGGAGTVTSVGLSAPTGFTVSNSPVTSSGTLTFGFTAGYSLPTTSSQTNWDTAYTERRQWDGGSTSLVAATGRTSLGLGTSAVLDVGTSPNNVVQLDGTSRLPAVDGSQLLNVATTSSYTVLVPVRNDTASSIAKGVPVYVTGANGNTLTIAPADASTELTAALTIGLTQTAIGSNSNGYVMAVGELGGINTSALTVGALVWLSETTGQLTSTRPTQPAHSVVIGYCVKQGAGSSGIIYIKVDNGLELNELHDVLITGAVTDQALVLAADGLWKNRTIYSSTTPAALGTAAVGTSTTLARADHVHANPTASQITDSTTAGRALLTAADAAAQRTSLGLGGAAVLNVGTSAGTVAAGNDSRLSTNLTYTASTRALASSTGTGATLPLFTSTDAGLAPSSGGGTSNYLRADGTWAVPPGGAGSVTSVGLSAPTGFTVSNSPITSSGTIALAFTAGYSLPTTASQTTWDSAYTERRQWDGGSTNLVAATGRTSLGLGGAATLNVGTTAGTVAAGNDSRFAGANLTLNSLCI